MSRLRHSVAALLLLVSACASQNTPSTSDRPARNPDVITREELQDPAIAASNAQYAVQQLRPAFFRTRGTTTLRQTDPGSAPGNVQISQDFGPLQPVGNLAAIEVRSLIEIRYLNAVDAQARFGINANGGPVIVLLTTKQ